MLTAKRPGTLLTFGASATAKTGFGGGGYVLKEDGGRIILEDGSGFVLIEAKNALFFPATAVAKQASVTLGYTGSATAKRAGTPVTFGATATAFIGNTVQKTGSATAKTKATLTYGATAVAKRAGTALAFIATAVAKKVATALTFGASATAIVGSTKTTTAGGAIGVKSSLATTAGGNVEAFTTFSTGAGGAIGAPFFPVIPEPVTVQNLVQSDTQKRLFVLQVWRNNSWATVPVETAQGDQQKQRAGTVSVSIPYDPLDSRTVLQCGERIRIFRGVEGAPLVRCFTGVVDAPNPVDSAQGISRQTQITDMWQELNTCMMLDGRVFDGLQVNDVFADIVTMAINSQQYKKYDDAGNLQSSIDDYADPDGNPIAYFPDLFLDTGAEYTLPIGTLGSFTGVNSFSPYASFSVPPVSSFTNYATFELPQQYIIASTMDMPGFRLVSSTNFPPGPGNVILDAYNGLLYFDEANVSDTVSFTCYYYSSPLFNYPSGRMCADVVSEICDKVGMRLLVDGTGKLYTLYLDVIRAPSRIYNKANYISNGITVTRDRRNVIVALGWDGNCGEIVAAKCINSDDIDNEPPVGLGKRSYMVVQDPSWQTQYAVTQAAYYAVQQVGRRGKVAAITILDDPTIQLEDVIAFEGTFDELDPGDLFYVEGIQWTINASGGTVTATSAITGTCMPGRGTFYLGPATAVTALGSLDYATDVRPVAGGTLVPEGGSFQQTFSIAVGLDLTYTLASDCTESIDVYGSDGSHFVLENNIPRSAGFTSLPLVADYVPGIYYVVKLWVKDANGNIGIYRDYIQARP